MKNYLKMKADWKMIVFLAAIALAVFLRVWHFHDWLFFKMDQARDALLAMKALQSGPGWLPLLGPKAGGTTVDLGPIFYYFQYLSAFIFQSAHPAVLAYPDLLFAILSIPLFYFFLKKYFSREWSMVLTVLYAFCFLAVEYSRFAWNPNSLVFWNLLYFYSLLNIFDEKIKYRFRWVVIAGLSLAISTQLHFLSMATLPVTTVIFLIFNWRDTKKMITWQKILAFFLAILVVYIPVILSDTITHGQNSLAFLAAVKSKPSHHSLWNNFNRDIRYWGQYWLLILTSYISTKGNLVSSAIAWLGAMLPGFFLALRNFRREKDAAKKRFVLVSILWFLAYFLIYISIAYQIRPRFFLPLISLPFIFLGYELFFLWERKSKIIKAIVPAVILVVLIGNIMGTYFWFAEIKPAEQKGVYPKRTIILIARDGIVLWHLENGINFMKQDCPNKKIYVKASSEYKAPVRYLMNLKNMEYDPIDNYGGNEDACFYVFGLTRSKKFSLDNKEKFDVVDARKIGALTVYKLQPKSGENFVPAGEKIASTKRIFWRDVLPKLGWRK